jgi:hypothetical protein
MVSGWFPSRKSFRKLLLIFGKIVHITALDTAIIKFSQLIVIVT